MGNIMTDRSLRILILAAFAAMFLACGQGQPEPLGVSGASLVAASSPRPQWLPTAAPSLGTASGFAVLGGSTVINTGATTIVGNLGVAPGVTITGFPPGVISGGTVDAGDAVAQQAETDVTTAYNVLAGDTCDQDLTGTDLGGLTLQQGVYCFSTSAQLTGTLTLDAQGNADAVFIFQIGSTLTTASGAAITMINGGQSCNVFWQVGSSATLGVGTTFTGSILALTSITVTTGASVAGRILAQNGAVTMDTNQITVGSCGGSSSGDPHFITFDGLYYSLMTPGDFILVRSPTVVVQARHALICSGAAVNVAAAAQLGSDRVAVFVAPLRVFVNGAPTTLTSAATRLPGGATASLNNAVVKVVGTQGSVTFTGLSSGGISGWINLGITLTSSLSTVTGLLGNSDGNPSNDLATRDGQNLALPVTSSQGLDAFAATWAVPPSESLFGGVTSLASQQSSTCPPSASALSAAQAVCTTAGISNPTLLEACMFDVAVTGNPDAAEVFVSLPPPKLVLSFDDVGAAVQRPVNHVAGCSTTPGGGEARTPWLLLAAAVIASWRRQRPSGQNLSAERPARPIGHRGWLTRMASLSDTREVR